MSYTDGEAAILTRIRAHLDYSALNTDANDWGIINDGNSAFYAILRPGNDPAPIEFISPTMYVVQWRTIIESWRRYVDDGSTATNLFGDVNKIIGQMQADKTLGLTAVEVSLVTSITPPVKMWNRDGTGPAWLVQEAILEWREESLVTYV